MSAGMKPTGKQPGNPNTGMPAMPKPTMPPADVSMSTALPPEIGGSPGGTSASANSVKAAMPSKNEGSFSRSNPENRLPPSAFHKRGAR
jgi:hypothetical protein